MIDENGRIICSVYILREGKIDDIRFPDFCLDSGECSRIPRVGAIVSNGSRKKQYLVKVRVMPLVEDWERYGGKPPRVYVEKI